jgi:sporulation protein YlmC with PRC-barrel domain
MKTANSLIALSAGAMLLSGAAYAQQASTGRGEAMTSVPTSAKTVTDWYKQSVYDKSDNKIGSIDDVLVDPNAGQINALIVGVGGVIGSEKDIAVDFNAVKPTTKNDKVYLTMDTTQDALKKAPGLKYDRNKSTWVPDTSSK